VAFAKIESRLIYSANENLTSPAIDSLVTQSVTPASFYRHKAPIPQSDHESPGTVIDLSGSYLNIASPSVLQVTNSGASEISVEYWNKLADLPHPAAGITWTNAGTEGLIEDLTAGGTLFKDVHIGDVLFSANAGNAGNRKLYLVQELPQGGAANDWPKRVIVSLYGSSMVTHVADDAASFVHGNRCCQILTAGQVMTIPAKLMDIDLRTITGTSTLDTQYNEIQIYSPGGVGEAEVIIF
tara:strand:- start:12090 stop:12809 length:720 start_codon:yes stop_codon:yes gene_type:complete